MWVMPMQPRFGGQAIKRRCKVWDIFRVACLELLKWRRWKSHLTQAFDIGLFIPSLGSLESFVALYCFFYLFSTELTDEMLQCAYCMVMTPAGGSVGFAVLGTALVFAERVRKGRWLLSPRHTTTNAPLQHRSSQGFLICMCFRNTLEW